MIMFEEKVSVFKTIKSTEPYGTVRLQDWIKQTTTKNKFIEHIERIQAAAINGEEGAKRREKAKLPAVTVGGQFEGRRIPSNLTCPTGWIAVDADAQDNGDESGDDLKEMLSKSPYVAFSALSVSGMGAWALVQVEDPWETERHYNALYWHMRDVGVVLDTTKGANVNDARYLSYDPEPKYRGDAEVFVARSWKHPRKGYPAHAKKGPSALRNRSGFHSKNADQGLLARVNEALMEIGTPYGNGEIRFSCVEPGHEDNNPSAFWNTQEGYGHCFACQGSGEGWSTKDMAALLNISLIK